MSEKYYFISFILYKPGSKIEPELHGCLINEHPIKWFANNQYCPGYFLRTLISWQEVPFTIGKKYWEELQWKGYE